MPPSKTKVGLLTFSDGRKYIHDDLLEVNWRYQNSLAAALENTDVVEEVDLTNGAKIPVSEEGN